MIHYRSGHSLADFARIMPVISELDPYYPGVTHWLVNKVMPGVMVGNDKLLLAEADNNIVGVAIVKDTDTEKKLRCVRVIPSYQGRGVAIHLIDRALTMLDCDMPATSVPEELMHSWSRILINRFNFSVEHVAKGLYRKGRLEYYFNTAPTAESNY